MLFNNTNKHKVLLPSEDDDGFPANINFLVHYLCNNIMVDSRKELFVVDGSVYLHSSQNNHKVLIKIQTTWHPSPHQRCRLGA
jgi:Urm1 (Ubiquitin related modifier)